MPVDARLLEPIEGPNRAGEDLEYDVVYDEIQALRQKIDRPPAQNDPDPVPASAVWRDLVKISSKTLRTRSKDLQVAGWLTEGWLKTRDLEGLLDGLVLTRMLLEEYWDEVYPLPEDGDYLFRAKPLEWMNSALSERLLGHECLPGGISQRVYDFSREVPSQEEAGANEALAKKREAMLSGSGVAPEEIERVFRGEDPATFAKESARVEQLLSEVEGLRELCDGLFQPLAEEDRPTFRDLRVGLETIQRTLLRYGPAPEVGEPAVPDEDQAPDSPSDAQLGRPGSEGVTVSSPQTAAAAVLRAARFLRKNNPSDPTPYLLVRSLRWGELHARGGPLDPLDLQAPSMADRVRLNGHLVRSEWAELLEAAEEVAASPAGRGWLDVHRMSVVALRELGEEYSYPEQTLRRFLSGFLADHPALPSMLLSDGTAAANNDTLAWLRAEGIHDTAPLIRELLERIEGAAIQDWSLARAPLLPSTDGSVASPD